MQNIIQLFTWKYYYTSSSGQYSELEVHGLSLPCVFHLLRGLQFPKKENIIYILDKEKYEWASSALGKKRRKKKELYFSFMGKNPRANPPRLHECSWVLEALGFLKNWQLERVSLEAVRLSFCNLRTAMTRRETLEAVKHRSSRKSF
ncbi:histone H2A.N-like [Camelus bactrianus]|uniref:Histone H2A.N-like n=1 Tax=Camelus bactrianus TaxID=9837 RepID=A0AC58QNV8_CAMBA